MASVFICAALSLLNNFALWKLCLGSEEPIGKFLQGVGHISQHNLGGNNRCYFSELILVMLIVVFLLQSVRNFLTNLVGYLGFLRAVGVEGYKVRYSGWSY